MQPSSRGPMDSVDDDADGADAKHEPLATGDAKVGETDARGTRVIKRKRVAVVSACVPCRAAKLACDPGEPCNQCVRRSRVELCQRVSRGKGKKTGPRSKSEQDAKPKGVKKAKLAGATRQSKKDSRASTPRAPGVRRACERCRASKVACDSSDPCSVCVKKGMECIRRPAKKGTITSSGRVDKSSDVDYGVAPDESVSAIPERHSGVEQLLSHPLFTGDSAVFPLPMPELNDSERKFNSVQEQKVNEEASDSAALAELMLTCAPFVIPWGQQLESMTGAGVDDVRKFLRSAVFDHGIMAAEKRLTKIIAKTGDDSCSVLVKLNQFVRQLCTTLGEPEHMQLSCNSPSFASSDRMLRLVDLGLVLINGDHGLLQPQVQHEIAHRYGYSYMKQRRLVEFVSHPVRLEPLFPTMWVFPSTINSVMARVVGRDRDSLMAQLTKPGGVSSLMGETASAYHRVFCELVGKQAQMGIAHGIKLIHQDSGACQTYIVHFHIYYTEAQGRNVPCFCVTQFIPVGPVAPQSDLSPAQFTILPSPVGARHPSSDNGVGSNLTPLFNSRHLSRDTAALAVQKQKP